MKTQGFHAVYAHSDALILPQQRRADQPRPVAQLRLHDARPAILSAGDALPRHPLLDGQQKLLLRLVADAAADSQRVRLEDIHHVDNAAGQVVHIPVAHRLPHRVALPGGDEGRLTGHMTVVFRHHAGYKIEKGKKITIAITGDNKKTCLYVNGKLREELGPLTVYAMQQKDLISFQKNDITAWQPIMYNPSAKMHYQRTLVFPLQQAGNFKSQITGVKVVQNQE